MVLQRREGRCTDTSEGLRPCSRDVLMRVSSVKEADRRYVLNPGIQDKDTIVTINMILIGEQIDNILYNDVALLSRNKEVLNVTSYKLSGQFSLYRVHLLAIPGKIECSTTALLILSEIKPFIHVRTKADIFSDIEENPLAQGVTISNNSLVNVNETESISNTINGNSTSNTGTTYNTSVVIAKITTMSTMDRTNQKVLKQHSNSHLNDILKHEANSVLGMDKQPYVPQTSGIPLVVKEAKLRDEINFHEAESRIALPANKNENSRLDVTVIAVIVSLASAVILVIVVVFGFLIAEFWCRRIDMTKVSIRRIGQKSRKIGDSGPLIQDDFEMLPLYYEGEKSP